MSFLWCPGRGCDAAALARLRDAFPQPRRPMGEAWFLGDRSMYEWLYEDVETIPAQRIETALEAIASGTSCFGPLPEWEEWFHYLLPRLLPRRHDVLCAGSVLDGLVTAFVTQYPNGLATQPYPGFGADVLATLGRALMGLECWPDGQLDVEVALGSFYLTTPDGWWWHDVSGKLSASLFFCLKYLPCDEVQPWLASVLAIASPPWRAQTIAFLVGAHPLLVDGTRQPGELPMSAYPDVSWFWSHALTGNYTSDRRKDLVLPEFVPARNREAAMTAVADHVDGAGFADWLAAISADAKLDEDLGELPFELHRLYRRA